MFFQEDALKRSSTNRRPFCAYLGILTLSVTPMLVCFSNLVRTFYVASTRSRRIMRILPPCTNKQLHEQNLSRRKFEFWCVSRKVKWCHIYIGFCWYVSVVLFTAPDSKVHGANMGPTWVLSAPDGSHVGPMNLAIRDGCVHLFLWYIFYYWHKRVWVESLP